MSYAERNRAIKKMLVKAFAPHKVTVKGDRGTASGWVKIKIDYRPKDRDERDTLKAKIWELFAAAKISIGTYGYDDPGSDYGFGSKCMIDFGRMRDEFRDGERVAWNGKTGTVKDRPYNRGGDWYLIEWDGSSERVEFYKGDLKSLDGTI